MASLKNKIVGGGMAVAIAIAIPVIEDLEGTEHEAYFDTGQVATVCTGHTGLDVEFGKIYSEKECKALLEKDLQVAAKALTDNIKVDITPKEAAAYLSFTINVGRTNFATSTLLKKLNAGDHTGACNQLMRWVYDNGQWLKGLYNRRVTERNICLQGAIQWDG